MTNHQWSAGESMRKREDGRTPLGLLQSSCNQTALSVPRITFGMIVLNGEPFTRYNLRHIYPWAHQIIVVEGACAAAAGVADAKGHSTDGTLDTLRRFKAEEDPEGKLTIVTAEDEGHPDGFWPGEKHEMSQAYAKRTTGSYLWQVDADEFYREEDFSGILKYLEDGVGLVSVPYLSFWGGIDYLEDGKFMRVDFSSVHRVFAWGPGHHYVTHRPPTVIDSAGQNVADRGWVRAAALKKQGIFMYHYSMILPKQIREKCSYYSRVDWAPFQLMEQWAEQAFFNLKKPFAVCRSLHIPLSWLEEYHGPHPKQILEMIENIQAGQHPNVLLRRTDDILQLIRTPRYRLGRLLRKVWVAMLLIRSTLRSYLLHSKSLRCMYHWLLRRPNVGAIRPSESTVEES